VAVTPGEACVHYNAKRIDLTGLKNGNLVELMNLFSIEGSEVALPKVCDEKPVTDFLILGAFE
jgi:hypothetical protein